MSTGLIIFIVGIGLWGIVTIGLTFFFGMPTPIENELVRNWREHLEHFGIKIDNDTLEKAFETNKQKSKERIPFELIFSEAEYEWLLGRISANYRHSALQSSYKNVSSFKSFGIETDLLETALYVKNLLTYIQTIQDSKNLVGLEQNRERWSEKAKKKWAVLEKEHVETQDIVDSIIYPVFLEEDWFRLSFSNESLLSEDERLELVDKKMEQGKPVFRKKSVANLPVTSPALIEINDFLNQHELPEAVESELKETMNKIQEKLKNQTRKSDEEKLLLDASVLNTTAKDYHQLS